MPPLPSCDIVICDSIGHSVGTWVAATLQALLG
jgi:hypothetical protein